MFLFGSGLFEIMFFLVFFLVFGMILVSVIKGVGQWNQNNNSPRLTVPVTVVSKRTNVSHHHHAGEHHHSTTSTTYYVTFQVESGDRMEMSVSRQQYGMLAEGDYGRLSFQGTRFLSFERQ